MRNTLIIILTLLTFASCKPAWTDEDRQNFTQVCAQRLEGQGIADVQATCGCMADSLSRKYPNPEEIDEASTTQAGMLALASHCRIGATETPATWDDAARKRFLAGCAKMAKAGTIPDSAKCPCILQQVETRYPSLQDLQGLDANDYYGLAKECK